MTEITDAYEHKETKIVSLWSFQSDEDSFVIFGWKYCWYLTMHAS